MANNETFEGYAILELMEHRRLAGWVTEQEIAGHGMLRIDIPSGDATVTQFYSPTALYALTPCTEGIAREIARQAPAPVSRWDIRHLLPEPDLSACEGPEDYDDGEEDEAI